MTLGLRRFPLDMPQLHQPDDPFFFSTRAFGHVSRARVETSSGAAGPIVTPGRGHQAIDIFAPQGTPVVATTHGFVVYSWHTSHGRQLGVDYSSTGGWYVLIVSGNHAHYYAHLRNKPLVYPGHDVYAGMPIGFLGRTGTRAEHTAPHLHYQVWRIGEERLAEYIAGAFTRRFAEAVNPYPELFALRPRDVDGNPPWASADRGRARPGH